MYAIRPFQQREAPEWIMGIGTEPDRYVPLPFHPGREISGLIIAHRGMAYIWEIVTVEEGDGQEVACGSDEDQPISAVTIIRPEGTPRVRTITGRVPRRIDYCDDWREFAR